MSKPTWTAAEIGTLTELSPKLERDLIARRLRRTPSAVAHMQKRLGLPSKVKNWINL